jgi:hypothetical protein
MLRASAQATGISIDLRAIGDRGSDSGRSDGAALLGFTDALVGRTTDLAAARQRLIDELGVDAVAPAAAAAGNFEMMNRVVDAVGVSVPPSMWAIAPEIGLRSEADDD